MIDFLHFLSILINTVILVTCIVFIYKGRRNAVYIVICEFYIFFIIPLILELFNGNFNYSFYGFLLSSQSFYANILTYIFLLVCPIILLLFGRAKYTKKKKKAELFLTQNFTLSLPMRMILIGLMASPILIALLTRNINVLLEYGWIVQNSGSNEIFSYIFTLTFIAVISAGIYVYSKPKLSNFEKVLLFILVLMSIFINGKRNIVALVFIIFLLVGYGKRILNGKKLVLTSLIGVFLLIVYSTIYQLTIRGDNLVLGLYDNYFIDISRHDRVRMAIFSLINPETLQILEYYGQSIIFYLTFFVPRSIWPDKPYPYHTYFTTSLVIPGNSPEYSSPDMVVFGMTTSWFDEAFSNFGWMGFIIGPMTIALLCRLADKQPPILKWFTIYMVLIIVRTEIIPLMLYFWLFFSVYAMRRVKIVREKLLVTDIKIDSR